MAKSRFTPTQMANMYQDYVDAGGQIRQSEVFDEVVLSIRKAGYEIISEGQIAEPKEMIRGLHERPAKWKRGKEQK
jgi:hypothetical protein